MDLGVDLKKLKLGVQPHVLAGILNLKEDSNVGFAELDRLVKADQNLAAFILKAANSSLYSRGNEIRTLQHAIAMLGFQIVRSLAMAAASKTLFEQGNYARFRRLVWEHSIVTAITARDIATKMDKKEHLEESFIAGLLHDMGKVVMNSVDRKNYIAVINAVENEDVSFEDAEKRLFGYSHLDVGGLAAAEWNLPAIYRPILAMHKDVGRAMPELADEAGETLLLLVAYANYIAKVNGYGKLAPGDEEDGEGIARKLGISDKLISYYTSGYKDIVQRDEYFKFFMTVV